MIVILVRLAVVGFFILIRVSPIFISMLVLVISFGVIFRISGMLYMVAGVTLEQSVACLAYICLRRPELLTGMMVLVL